MNSNISAHKAKQTRRSCFSGTELRARLSTDRWNNILWLCTERPSMCLRLADCAYRFFTQTLPYLGETPALMAAGSAASVSLPDSPCLHCCEHKQFVPTYMAGCLHQCLAICQCCLACSIHNTCKRQFALQQVTTVSTYCMYGMMLLRQ